MLGRRDTTRESQRGASTAVDRARRFGRRAKRSLYFRARRPFLKLTAWWRRATGLKKEMQGAQQVALSTLAERVG
ncbi:MAG: hypothetical protein ACXVIJ_06450, partial [Thermoanaerobaculia bacterium]